MALILDLHLKLGKACDTNAHKTAPTSKRYSAYMALRGKELSAACRSGCVEKKRVLTEKVGEERMSRFANFIFLRHFGIYESVFDVIGLYLYRVPKKNLRRPLYYTEKALRIVLINESSVDHRIIVHLA